MNERIARDHPEWLSRDTQGNSFSPYNGQVPTWLDFYCIGPLHTLEDRLGLEQVRDIYRFHQANERWLLDTVELADAGLVVDGVRGSPEYRGLYNILAESHVSFDLVFLDGDLRAPEMASDAERWLRFIPAAMFGPPEKCYFTNVSEIPALYRRAFGKGTVVWFPWSVGAHYERQGHLGHAALVEGALTRLLELPRRLRVEASPLVEANHRIARDGTFEWISLLNLSGQVDKGLHAPLPQRDLPLGVNPQRKVSSVRLLQANREVQFQQADDGQLRCIVPRLEAWEIILLQ